MFSTLIAFNLFISSMCCCSSSVTGSGFNKYSLFFRLLFSHSQVCVAFINFSFVIYANNVVTILFYKEMQNKFEIPCLIQQKVLLSQVTKYFPDHSSSHHPLVPSPGHSSICPWRKQAMLRHYSPLSSPSPPKNNQRDLLKTEIKSCSSLLRPLQWFSITYYSPNFKFELCLLHFVSCFLLSSSVHLRCAGSFTSAVLSACCNLFLNRVLANSFPSFKSFLSSPLRRAVFRWPIWNIFSSSLYPYFIFLYIYHCLIVFLLITYYLCFYGKKGNTLRTVTQYITVEWMNKLIIKWNICYHCNNELWSARMLRVLLGTDIKGQYGKSWDNDKVHLIRRVSLSRERMWSFIETIVMVTELILIMTAVVM